MLDQIARHGLIDLDIQADGDLHIDGHHTVEDVGITWARRFAQGGGRQEGHPPLRPRLCAAGRSAVARGDRFLRPPGLVMNVPFKSGMIGGFDSQLAHEFFQGFVNHAFVTLHIDNLRGENAHHQCETCSRPLPAPCVALERDPRAVGTIPSTKGSL
jgi:imidazoleglycerol-phosphate dehydratase